MEKSFIWLEEMEGFVRPDYRPGYRKKEQATNQMENLNGLPGGAEGTVLPCGTINLGTGEVAYHDGGRDQLLPQELALFRHLFLNAGRVVTRAQLLKDVWGLAAGNLETRTVDMHVSMLRRKLRVDGKGTLRTIRGQGYLFEKFAPS